MPYSAGTTAECESDTHEDAAEAYGHLLKYGLSRNYWNDYLMDASVNHSNDVTMLARIPDVPASLPHLRGNEP